MCAWYRCQNRIEKYYHHDGEKLTFYLKIPTHLKSRTRDLGPWTHTWDPGPFTWHSRPGTHRWDQDPGSLGGTQDLGPFLKHSHPYISYMSYKKLNGEEKFRSKLLELSRMVLVNSVTFVVLKILHNLVSMQNSLNANNCWGK